MVTEWNERVTRAVEHVGTPCFVSAWSPVAQSLAKLDELNGGVPVRSWLSYKTHPLPALAERWVRSGRGVEVVSEREFVSLLELDVPIDQLLVNGVAKHTWLGRYPLPRLRVHFDSLSELDRLLPVALQERWRVGIRLQAPDQRDARAPEFRDQFGMSGPEALAALRLLRTAGADFQSVHFHLGQHALAEGAYVRAVDYLADICDDADVAPLYLDCGGALPALSDEALTAAFQDLDEAVRRACRRCRSLREIWLENGRFVTEHSTALAVRVTDIKERDDSRYLVCDGGRTNHALAADNGPHRILVIPTPSGDERLTTVCGPTCMSDDRLGRWMLPTSIAVGDVIAWLDAGAYHLPWETRFSHGLCAIVWFDGDERLTVARQRETISARVDRVSVLR